MSNHRQRGVCGWGGGLEWLLASINCAEPTRERTTHRPSFVEWTQSKWFTSNEHIHTEEREATTPEGEKLVCNRTRRRPRVCADGCQRPGQSHCPCRTHSLRSPTTLWDRCCWSGHHACFPLNTDHLNKSQISPSEPRTEHKEWKNWLAPNENSRVNQPN